MDQTFARIRIHTLKQEEGWASDVEKRPHTIRVSDLTKPQKMLRVIPYAMALQTVLDIKIRIRRAINGICEVK